MQINIITNNAAIFWEKINLRLLNQPRGSSVSASTVFSYALEMCTNLTRRAFIERICLIKQFEKLSLFK